MKVWVLENYDGVNLDAGAYLSQEAAENYADRHRDSSGRIDQVTALEVKDHEDAE